MAEFRRLNAHASRGGGDRAAIAKVSKKQQNRSSSLASAYARRYAEQCPDAVSALESLSFDESDEVSIGMRVGVPRSHPNKYGYATSAIVVSVSRRQCVQLIEHARGQGPAAHGRANHTHTHTHEGLRLTAARLPSAPQG